MEGLSDRDGEIIVGANLSGLTGFDTVAARCNFSGDLHQEEYVSQHEEPMDNVVKETFELIHAAECGKLSVPCVTRAHTHTLHTLRN